MPRQTPTTKHEPTAAERGRAEQAARDLVADIQAGFLLVLERAEAAVARAAVDVDLTDEGGPVN